jgi:hypothetical protein
MGINVFERKGCLHVQGRRVTHKEIFVDGVRNGA